MELLWKHKGIYFLGILDEVKKKVPCVEILFVHLHWSSLSD